MPGTAPLATGYYRQWHKPPGFIAPAIGPAGGGLPGTPILQQQFGQQLVLSVQVAWGAQVGTSPSSWTWTDITGDVQAQQRVPITVGRANEATAAQPASLSLTLDNRAGLYTQGPQSANYPNVVKGVPVQVVLYFGGAAYTRFFGYAADWHPGWDVSGNYAIVTLTASGAKRRISQGTSALNSPLTRSIPGLSSLVAYWPCEDGSSAANLSPYSGLNAVLNPIYPKGGTFSPASNSAFVATASIPTLNNDIWYANLPPYTDSGSGQIRFLLSTPSAGLADQTGIIRLFTTGTIRQIDLLYAGTPSAGGLRCVCWDAGHVNIADTGTVGFAVAGANVRLGLSWTLSGGNTTVQISTLTQVPGASASYVNLVATGYNVGLLTGFQINRGGTITGVGLGQVYVQNLADDIFTLALQLQAFAGESPGARISRLCTEQGEQITVTGSTHQQMGPQQIDTFINLLQDAEAVDRGMLCDGLNAGLTYIAHQWHENDAGPWRLDASIGQVEHPLDPVDDDLLTCNDFTASRRNGSSAAYVSSDPLWTPTRIGTYDNAVTQGFYTDGQQLQDYASWQVHMGTMPGYRWPTATMKIHHHPELARTWLNAPLGALGRRAQIVNLSDVRVQLANASIDLLLEGYTETFDQFTWQVDMNCSPWDGWRIGTLAQPSGDLGEFVLRLETASSSTAASLSATLVPFAEAVFPNGTGSWSAASNAAAPQSAKPPVAAPSGQSAALLGTCVTGGTTFTYNDGPNYPVTGNTAYAIGGAFLSQGAAGNLAVFTVNWFGPSGYISTTTTSSATLSTSAWSWCTQQITSPPGATDAQIEASGSASTSGTGWYMDSVFLLPAAASSLSVSSTDLWTTAADDFPLWCSIGGQKIQVTSITGSSSPFTFTLNGATVTVPVPAGAAVSVWTAPVLDVQETV